MGQRNGPRSFLFVPTFFVMEVVVVDALLVRLNEKAEACPVVAHQVIGDVSRSDHGG